MSTAGASTGSAEAATDIPSDRIETSKLFKDEDADFILRCHITGKEGHYTDFKVHRAKLAISPVFADMLDCGGNAQADGEQLPVVVLSESARAIEMLLRFLYGKTGRLLGPYDEFRNDMAPEEDVLYEACFKYDLPVAALATEALILSVASARFGRSPAESCISPYLERFPVEDLLRILRIAHRNDRPGFLDECLECVGIIEHWAEGHGQPFVDAIALLTTEEIIMVVSASTRLSAGLQLTG